MSKFRSFGVWLLEMISEAVGTTLWMAVLALIQFGPDHSHYPYGYAGVLVGISSVVLIEFAITGYLLTTLLSALFVPRNHRYLYPAISLSLYLIHSEIFFIAAGNRMFVSNNLAIQLGGGCIAFAVTLAGDHMRHSKPQQLQS